MGTLCSPYLTFPGARTSETELVRNLRVRAANPDDLTKICEIEDASFSRDPYPAFLIQRLLNDENSLFLVATCEEDEIIGYLVSKIEDRAAHLISLAVLPTQRRLGAATQLLNELTEVLRQRSVREIKLEVRPDNRGAIELYAQFSFREESVIPQYYSDGSPASHEESNRMNCRLFVVDVGEDRTHAEPSLRLWGVDDDDHRILTVLTCLKPYFYFLPSHDNDLTSIQDSISKTFPKMQVTIEHMKRLGRPVKTLKISCPDYNAMNECVKLVRKKAIPGEMFEDDLRLPVRYTTDLEVIPSAWLQVDAEPVVMEQVETDRIYATSTEPRNIKLSTPTLRMMAFSILTLGLKGSAKPDRDPIRAIAVTTEDNQPELKLADNDDKQLLTWFVKKVRSVDPDILVSFNNREQWLYLLERCRQNKVKLDVGRDSSEPHTSSYGHISIAGRATLDLLDYANGIADLKVKELSHLAAYLHVPSADAIQFIDDLELASLWEQEDGRRKLNRNTAGKALACFQLGKLTLTYAIQLSALTSAAT